MRDTPWNARLLRSMHALLLLLLYFNTHRLDNRHCLMAYDSSNNQPYLNKITSS